MLRNLKEEMAKKNITHSQIADLLNKKRVATITDKINGHYRFEFEEAAKIKRHFFPDHDIEYLFENEDNKEGKSECLM